METIRVKPKVIANLHIVLSRDTIENSALLLILVLGGCLRFWNITVGLPVLYEHDEIFEVHRALELLRGEYNFYRTKGMYFYFLALFSWLYGSWLIFMGTFLDLKEFISYSMVHPGDIVLLSRFLCSSLGVLSIFLFYKLGKQIFPKGSWCPLLLSLTWATCGLGVWISRWGVIESTIVVFSLLAFRKILLLFENRALSNYMWIGLFIACATATKIYGIMLLLPFWFAHTMSYQDDSFSWRWQAIIHKKVLVTVFIFGFFLVILNPALPVQMIRSVDGGILPNLSADTEAIYPFPFYFKHLRWNVGNVGMVFFFIGAIFAIVRFEKKILTCGIFAISFFLLFGLKKEAVFIYERYLLTSLPFFFLVGVYGLENSWRWIASRVALPVSKERGESVVMGLAAIGFVMNGLSIILPNPVMGQPFVPVHQQALEWFSSHVPEGSTVVIRGEVRPWPGNQNLPLFDLKENYLKQYERKRAEGRTPAEIDYLLDLAQAADVVRYNLINETRYVLWQSPHEYIVQEGADYFVVDVEHFDDKFTSRRSQAATASRREFYRLLRNSEEVTLLKVFKGFTVTGGLRTIEVYKVNK